MTLKSSKTKKQVFKLWAVYEDIAICHITVPGAPYLSTSLRYSLEEYKRIMKAELHPQKKSTKKITGGKMSLGLNNQKPVLGPAPATTPPKPQPKPGMTLNESLMPQPRPGRIVTADNCLICGSGNAGQWICDTCIDSLKKSPRASSKGLVRQKCNACKQKRPCFAEFDMYDASRLPENCLFDKEKTPQWEDSGGQ